MKEHKGKIVVVCTSRGEDIIGECVSVMDTGYTLKNVRMIGIIPDGHQQAGSLMIMPYMPFCNTLEPGTEILLYTNAIQTVLIPVPEVVAEYNKSASPIVAPDQTIITP